MGGLALNIILDKMYVELYVMKYTDFSMKRFQNELVDFISFFLLAAPAVLLPWRWMFPFYRRMQKFDWLFRYQTHAARKQMQQNLALSEAEIEIRMQHYRLVLLIDAVDMWLSITRGRYVLKLIRQNKPWTDHRPLMVIGSHWGPGMLGIRSMSAHGLKPYFVIRPVPVAMRRERFFYWLYLTIRMWHLQRLLPKRRFNAGDSPRRLIELLSSDSAVFMLGDSPPPNRKQVIPVTVYGKPAFVHRGFSQILARREIPYLFFSMGMDWRTGQRVIELSDIVINDDKNAVQQDIAQFVENTLKKDEGQWQLWPHIDQFLQNSTRL